MQADDPPYLSVGTAVSAKYKGAFCEAKVSKVVRIVKCKVTYKQGLGTATVSDEQIKGTLRVGHTVQAKHTDKKDLVEATITKIQDCSQYTVVFDDGDITTLRRSALCLKSGRHFNESETLDQLPLTHPEHFGNPVVGGRRGRRNRQLKDDSSEGEAEEENEPDLEGYSTDIGRVVSVETTDKKRGKDNWFPGLVVIPSAQPTVRINVKDEYLVRSFKDGRYYTVPKKEVSEFNREMGDKVESTVLAEAVGKSLKYLDHNELPVHWERNSLFNMQSLDTDSEENLSDSSDDEPNEEKDRFVAQLYKFMDDSGTPLNKSPMIGNKDVDLHKFFRIVHKSGGYNRVTNQNKWRSVTNRLKFPNNQITYNQVKSVYKKFLLSYESFHRTLGVTMLNHTRTAKKNKGRSLIRDKDRATPINSPKPDKDDEGSDEKKDDDKSGSEEKVKKKRKDPENSDTNSGDATDQSDSVPSTSREVGRPKRGEKIKKLKTYGEQKKEFIKKELEDKMQQTRSKSSTVQAPKLKEILTSEKKVKDPPVAVSSPPKPIPESPKPAAVVKLTKKGEEEKKRGRKKLHPDDKDKPGVEIVTDSTVAQQISIGDKLKVYYGPTHESKVTYEAKVIEIDKDSTGPVYLVHYTGWNTRYDEWIAPNRIAENLSASTKAKRQKHGNVGGFMKNKVVAARRGRGMSITGRSTAVEAPRSTTPSSVTSSSSRTKSPATPATRSSSRMTRQDYGRKTRRASAQTDVSNHSESDTDISESESELTRTRSGSAHKPDEPELKTYRKRAPTSSKTPRDDKSKDKDDLSETDAKEKEVEECERPKRSARRPRKLVDDSDEEISVNPPKGRDFDLNQIRSELKGFTKALKVPASPDTEDKEASSSSSSSEDGSSNPTAPKTDVVEDKLLSKESSSPIKTSAIEKSPSSEDIYEFKEPEPFEFEVRTKMIEDKSTSKKRLPRLFEELEKSPKRRTGGKSSDKDSPDLEKKRFRRTNLRNNKDESEEDEKKEEDPFDKLVESPSFNIVKPLEKSATDTGATKQTKITRNILEEPLSLFRELPETVDDYSRDMELSDCESQTQPIFSREDELFSDTFSKSSPDRNALDLEFPKGDDLKKDTDDFASIRESITRAIERTPSSDECDDLSDDDLTITPSVSSYQGKKREIELSSPGTSEPTVITATVTKIVEEEKKDVKQQQTEEEKKISPALQESDSSLLEAICSQPVSIQAKLEETKDLNLKTGAKVADSILRKFNSIKNKTEVKSDDKDSDSEQEFKLTSPKKEDSDLEDIPATKLKIEAATKIKPTAAVASVELKTKPSEIVEVKKPQTPPQTVVKADSLLSTTTSESDNNKPTTAAFSSVSTKKKKKIVSKPIIEESDSDSSDSEQLVIAREDEDSQTDSFTDKPDLKESDSNNSAGNVGITDDSQSQQEEEQRNFKFDKVTEEEKYSPQSVVTSKESSAAVPVAENATTTTTESVRDEEPDSQLHSLLLCDETIPRSPAPVVWDVPETKVKSKTVLEMPFASAPSSSDNKLIGGESKLGTKPQGQLVLPLGSARDRSGGVLGNSPPTTPESSMSNSPRGDREDLSPNTVDNESGKSNDAEPDYTRKRRNSSLSKVPLYSEDDSQMTSENTAKRSREDVTPASCKKRRKSVRGADEAPAKRGRKPLNRSHHNSDSDDTSEHSIIAPSANLALSIFDRNAKSPRPSKYNFFVEFDPSLDSGQRIAVLQQKLAEIRKTYAEVKAELVAVERRRKKIRRREREALKASKQEMVCG